KRILALGAIGLGICSVVCSAQTPAATQRAAQQRPAANTAAKWTQPKTPWGEPDLQGIWPLNHLISTPFQRDEKFGERRFLTDEEFTAAQKSAESRNTRFEA